MERRQRGGTGRRGLLRSTRAATVASPIAGAGRHAGGARQASPLSPRMTSLSFKNARWKCIRASGPVLVYT